MNERAQTQKPFHTDHKAPRNSASSNVPLLHMHPKLLSQKQLHPVLQQKPEETEWCQPRGQNMYGVIERGDDEGNPGRTCGEFGVSVSVN